MRKYSLFLAAMLVAAQAAPAITDDERLQVYREFRALFDSKRYQEALPIAEKLVSLSIEQYGEKSREIVNPLANLGTTYHRLGNHTAAEQSYLRSVEILESTAGGATDRQLLRPLHGLGATYVALGRYEEASLVLKRAVDLSRNLNGLFNPNQLELLDPLIKCYVELGMLQEAEKEHQYAFRVAETAYGKTDVRLLEPLDRYARWYEFVGRYSTARALHARALSIAEMNGRGSPLTADPLRGIARTYRLEFVNGPEEQSDDTFNSNTGLTPSDFANAQRLNADGERALRMALQALESQQPVDHKRKGETLVELGDWYLSAGDADKALNTYRDAWKELELAGSTELLSQPRLLVYRPPSSSIKRSRLDPEDAEERYVEVRFKVTRLGKTENVVTSDSDAPESVQRSVVTAVKKARYFPRIENGEAVETNDVTLRERVLVRRSS